MKGERVSHFQIHERIGRGGMGEVYRAHDTRLGREVALKFLPAELDPDERKRKRFFREAQAASALDHPNICTIYEVDETEDGRIFLAMAYYRGLTLRERIFRGPLPVGEAIDVALQLARGLERAHEHGIVHRDLKPSNVFVTEDGLVKLLDFGLAKLSDGTRVTRSGTTVGTAGYMAPEQVLAHEVDHRADLWSFGIILFEMLTGRLPFTGDSEVSTLFAVVHSEPHSLRDLRPELPEEVLRVVERCMEKEPEDRYGTASAIRRDLERLQSRTAEEDVEPTQGWLAPPVPRSRPSRVSPPTPEPARAPHRAIAIFTTLAILLLAAVGYWLWRGGAADPAASAPPPRSVAVLPLENLSGRDDLQYLAEGVGAVLVGQLARVSGVDVVAREEAWSFRRRHPSASPTEIARELGVDAILEGQFVTRGEVSQVHLSLVDAATGFVSWSRTVEADRDRLLDLQSELAAQVAEHLSGSREAPAPDLLSPFTRSEEAYRLFVRAEALRTQDPPRVEEAIELLRRAVEVDPSFALAHASLSLAWSERVRSGHPEDAERALRTAERALEIAPTLPEASLARAEAWQAAGRLEEAIQELQALVGLYPELARASERLAIAYRQNGQLPEAERTVRQAIQRRPQSWELWNTLGGILLRQGEYDDARQSFREAASLTELDYGTPYENLAALELMQGNFAEALQAFDRLPRPIEDPRVASNIGTTYFYLDDMEEAARYYRLALRLRPSSAFHANLGDVFARKGDREAAEREYGRAADMLTAEEGEAAPAKEDAILRAMYLGKAGRCEEALGSATALEQDVSLTAQSTATLAKTRAACRDETGALRLLEQALERGYQPEIARGEEEFRSLVSNPRFQSLLARAEGP